MPRAKARLLRLQPRRQRAPRIRRLRRCHRSHLPPPPPPPGGADGNAAVTPDSLVEQVHTAAHDAGTAKKPADAEAALGRAKVGQALLEASPASTPAQRNAAANDVTSATSSLQSAIQADASLCGTSASTGKASWLCISYGLFAASLSVVQVGTGVGTGLSGSSNHHLTSVAVPFAAVRVLPWEGLWGVGGYVSLDVALYSAFLTQSLGAGSPTATKQSCSTAGGDFESKLPCEANASLQPYAGAYVGITVGNSKLAYLTLIPFTTGLAQVGTAPGLQWYSGWSLGVIQLNGNL